MRLYEDNYIFNVSDHNKIVLFEWFLFLFFFSLKMYILFIYILKRDNVPNVLRLTKNII
jgi:hypothetical protein